MKKFFLAFVLLLSFCGVNGQSVENNSKMKLEFGLNIGVESFFSSDLSILDNQPHENYYAPSYEMNLGIHNHVGSNRFS